MKHLDSTCVFSISCICGDTDSEFVRIYPHPRVSMQGDAVYDVLNAIISGVSTVCVCI